MSVLADGKSILCAIRMDGDAGCSSGTYRYYYQSYSTDRGLSWTPPRPIHGAGCARPRLRLLEPDGPLLLSGGRLCVENTTGLFLWVNEDGLAGLHGSSGGNSSSAEWVRHSLSFWHNHLWQGKSYYRFDDSVNESNAWGTLGYTSLIQTGPRSGAVLYNKFFSPHLDHGWPPWPCANFLMRFSFVPEEKEDVRREEVQRVRLKLDDGASLLLRTPPTSAADPLRSDCISVGVGNPPAGAAWFRVEQVDGPSFSGFPAWIPAYAQANYSVLWWSEYAVSDGRTLHRCTILSIVCLGG
jgi:hypothetical protein